MEVEDLSGSVSFADRTGPNLELPVSGKRTTWGSLIGFFQRNRIGFLGTIIVLLLVMTAVLADVITPYRDVDMPGRRLEPPSEEYFLGTDELGRDMFSRIVYGARVSLWVGAVCVSISMVVGGSLGILSGYVGGRVDSLIMRTMDVVFAFPGLIMALVIASVLGPSLTNAMIAIGIVLIPVFARTGRAPVLAVKEMGYIQAARCIGAKHSRLILRHILPNIATPLVVQATITLSAAILIEASLSFLGLGTQPPTPSWGTMLGSGRRFLETAPWVAVFPGLAIMITVLGFNLLGDGLRDYLDPRYRFQR